ncbi:uncharacterized protein LY89DRAFT_741693 [Mollisia scopiformis]|uniref:DUF6604 domain-containing protein n=1 Tax=Mollisia scopiformis TaxID=149040 RepID=A0A132BA36_MOLSC|nr:uncharacterized protein LY89DRAFT_741693 [Mollisia scopiformis]KUJ08859.1 hypothetical protein LY89DRAFT_741693 [Mollisia scopiformis]
MLSEFLEGTYKKYKNDTSTFLKWLYETGTKCGYVPDAPTTAKKQVEITPQKSARLKGKARKEAKAAKLVATSMPDTSAGVLSHEVPRRDLMPLAQAVLYSQDSSIKVPVKILQVGLRAVSTRKKLTESFSKNTEASDVETLESNYSHSYFNDLMERVILTLQPRFATMAGTNIKEKDPTQNNETIADLSAEPDYKFYEAEEDAREAKAFAFHCLFTDLNKLRSYVERVWRDYREDKLDLITASVVTNTAVQLAIRTQDEFVASFPGTGSYKDTWVTLYTEMGVKLFKEGHTFGMFNVSEDVEDWAFRRAYSILSEFTKVLNPKSIPMVKRGFYGVYHPQADRTRMSRIEKQQEDVQVLLEILPEFCFLAKFDIAMLGQDEVTRGLRQFALTKAIPIWLVFAVEIFLNIHHILRETVDSGFQVLTLTATRFTQTLNRYFELSDGFTKPKSWPVQNEQLFHILKDLMGIQIFNDAILP